MILMVSSSCETAGEKTDAGDQEPCLCAGDGGLEVLGEPAVASKPGEGSFDHPATGFCVEGADAWGSGDDLDCPFPQFGNCAEQSVSSVDAIGKDMPKPGERAAHGFEQRDSSVVVLDVGTVHEDRQERACRVGDDMALAAHHPLGRVKPTWAAAFRGLHALTVDDARRGANAASVGLSYLHNEIGIDAAPSPIVAPAIEIILNRRARWEVLRQRPPLTPGRQNVEDRIQHAAKIDRSRAAKPTLLGHEWSNQTPFSIRQIACVTTTVP